MKLKTIFLSLSMIALLSGCSNESVATDQLQDQNTQTLTTITEENVDSGTVTTEATTSETQPNTSYSTTQISPSTMTTTSQAAGQTPEELQLALPKKGEKIAIIETDLGTMKMKLFKKGIPELSKNFELLVKAGKYTDVPFHRVIKDFMIQTGDFTNKNGTGGHSYKGLGQSLANEITPDYHHLYGTVSMAKTSAPVSIGSQFFIVTNKSGYPFLDGDYSPIGQIFEGMDVAEKIADLQIPGDDAGTPSKIVNMKKVTFSTYKGQ